MKRWQELRQRGMLRTNKEGEALFRLVNANADPIRLTKKNHKKHIEQGMDEQFKEMGMTSIVFICFTRPDGQLAIDV